MANSEHLSLIKQGVPAFNLWRAQNPDQIPDLSGAELRGVMLSGADLRGAVLSGADLDGAHLLGADLRGATLVGASLQGVLLGGADLRGVKASWLAFNQSADTWQDSHGFASSHGVNMRNANLQDADLRGADLREADFTGACLVAADLRQADLRSANLEQANVTGVSFTRDCRQRAYFGVRYASCYGSQLFKSYVEGQVFLEEYRQIHPRWFWLWWLTSDCGHSLLRWALMSLFIAISFGLLYWSMGPKHFAMEHLPFDLMVMLYYSGVTFTTLGFGDIAPRTEMAAGLVMTEVTMGYIMLGGLISILAIKLGRKG